MDTAKIALNITAEHVEAGRRYATRISFQTKGGIKFEKGEAIKFDWIKDNWTKVWIVSTEDKKKKCKMRTRLLPEYIKGVGNYLSSYRMMQWISDGVAKSVGGKKVEPDGVDSDGTPSWLLALDMI